MSDEVKLAVMQSRDSIPVNRVQEALAFMQRQIDGFEQERDRYKAALEEIKRSEGKVCSEFMTCDHRSCNSSYAAWAIADEALTTDAQLVLSEELTEKLDIDA